MSSYGDPAPQHRNALAAVDQARQRAINAVSEQQQAPPPGHHPHLAPAETDGQPPLATVCTQAVVDYLLQLRPYRDGSRNWKTNFGTLELPKRVEGVKIANEPSSELWLCRQPEVPVRDLSEVIVAANSTIQYSSKKAPPSDAGVSRGIERWEIRGTTHGNLVFEDQGTWAAVLNGDMEIDEAVKIGAAERASVVDDKDEEYVPADPNISSSGSTGGVRRSGSSRHRKKSFKLVFPAQTLLQFVELADEVAAEMDLLADLAPPDYDAGGGGAV